MEYHGKLYGKIGGKYFDTGKTSDDFDNLEKQRDELLEALKELVELREMKFMDGEHPSDEYLKRKPLAWIKAKITIEKVLK